MSSDVQRCIGLMSGTSSDAIDAVLLEVSEDGRRAELIDTHSQPIDPELRERIRAVSQGENDRIDTVQALDVELAEHFSTHKDVNGIVYCGNDIDLIKSIQENASRNVKRVHYYNKTDWLKENGQSPYFIMDHTELKTTWHPIGS